MLHITNYHVQWILVNRDIERLYVLSATRLQFDCLPGLITRLQGCAQWVIKVRHSTSAHPRTKTMLLIRILSQRCTWLLDKFWTATTQTQRGARQPQKVARQCMCCGVYCNMQYHTLQSSYGINRHSLETPPSNRNNSGISSLENVVPSAPL